MEGIVTDLLSQGGIGIVFILNLVVDISIYELGEKPVIEEFPPAGGNQLAG